MSTKDQKVYDIVIQIPKGRVSTYGRVAFMAGIKNPRLVGQILHRNPKPEIIPCHRVVFSNGKVAKKFAFGGGQIQRRMLEKEGVIFKNNKVELAEYLWTA